MWERASQYPLRLHLFPPAFSSNAAVAVNSPAKHSRCNSRRVTLTFLCLTLVVALVTQEAQASKLKKVAKYALIGAALAPRVVPIPIPIGHHAHYEPHYDHGWHAGLHGHHGGWW
ncbi:hypothetical protein MTO96_010639 [Rhipicephalus appendiculatus]